MNASSASSGLFNESKYDLLMQAASGYGGALCARFRPEVKCDNLGRGGASSKSYRTIGAWDTAVKTFSEPGFKETYVLIQLGTNDGSDRPERHTELPEFKANIATFVDEVRAAGATPVLITVLTDRNFREGKLGSGYKRWADVQQFALGIRYRYIDNSAGVRTNDQGQNSTTVKARFKVDRAGHYAVNAGVFSGAPLACQSGISSSRARGSSTAPERMWAPISDPFSTTQTETSWPCSAASCFRRIAAARPEGPPPTITTSYSIASRCIPDYPAFL